MNKAFRGFIIIGFSLMTDVTYAFLVRPIAQPVGPKTDIQVPLIDNRDHRIQPDDGLSVPISNVSLGAPSYVGSGCPQGTTTIVLSQDNKSISVLFDHLSSEVGNAFGQNSAQLDCKLSIPIKAPAGYSVSVAQLDYRGFYSLPAGATASFWARHQIHPQQTTLAGLNYVTSQTFHGPVTSDFLLSATIPQKSIPKAHTNVFLPPQLNCGGSAVLDIETQLSVQSNSAGEDTLLELDTIDGQIKNSVDFHLVWQHCDLGDNNHP